MNGIYLKKFATHSEYTTYINGEGAVLPNVSYCIDNNEVHYNPFDQYNNHDYVDLGLPSGTKWAKFNVGANSETDYGLYFQWGDVQGYTASQVGSGEGQKYFGWGDYKYGNGGETAEDMTKYNSTDGKTVLEDSDDAAVVNMGGYWHMPDNAQLAELLDTNYVTNVWVNDYQGSGIAGRIFTSVADSTQTLFFPASGYCLKGANSRVGDYICVWTNTRGEMSETAWHLHIAPDKVGVFDNYNRNHGYVVRAVVGNVTE